VTRKGRAGSIPAPGTLDSQGYGNALNIVNRRSGLIVTEIVTVSRFPTLNVTLKGSAS
jgi:hypothetical protein